LTFPPTPSIGDRVAFLDVGDDFEGNNLTLGRNGSNIIGLAQDMTVDVTGASFLFVYISAAEGWTPESGIAGGLAGPVGPAGATGSTGAKGDTGDAGADGADGSGIAIEVFQAKMTTSGAITTAYVDVDTFDTPTIIDSSFSFNATTGVLTINHTGTVAITASARADITGGTRGTYNLALVSGASTILEEAKAYTRTTAGIDFSAVIPTYYLAVTSGDTIKLQEKYVTAACTTLEARLSVSIIK